MMGWYVMAGVRVMLKRATAAAEQRHGLGRTCDKARPYDGMRGFECCVKTCLTATHHVPRRFLSGTLSPAHGPQKGH